MKRKLDEAAIADILTATLLAGRLAPGLRLGEQQLAAVFGVSRERIRKVLQQLGHLRLIAVYPNRGAFIAEPGLREARAVYEARRILEGGVVSHLSSTLSPTQIEVLSQHLARERAADEAHDRAESVRLSGLFHTNLAELTGNEFILRQMQELVGRTAMLVAYHESHSPHCGCDEHAAILSAITAHGPAGAAHEMQLHLSLIETRLQDPPVRPTTTDLEDVLLEEIARWQAAQIDEASRPRHQQRSASSRNAHKWPPAASPSSTPILIPR